MRAPRGHLLTSPVLYSCSTILVSNTSTDARFRTTLIDSSIFCYFFAIPITPAYQGVGSTSIKFSNFYSHFTASMIIPHK